MAINKSALVGGMGVATTIVQTLVAEVKKAGGKEEDIHRLVTSDAQDVWHEIGKLIVKKEEELVESINELFTLKVDYTDISRYVRQGKYDDIADAITGSGDSLASRGVWTHDPIDEEEQKEEEATFKLFPCKRRGTISEDIVALMQKEGYRPAILQELLAFGARHQSLQRRYRIVALGSTLRPRGESRKVPLLQGSNTRREVTLRDFDRTWDHAEYFFLGVGKPVEEVTILVLGHELGDRQQRALQELFVGKRMNFIMGSLTDDISYKQLCKHAKPTMVVLPDKLPLFSMEEEIPHVIATSKAWDFPIEVMELLPLQPKLKPFTLKE